jgi:hypothetical protein
MSREAEIEKALRDMIDLATWMRGSGDFGPGGLAEVGWRDGRNRIGLAIAALALPASPPALAAAPGEGPAVVLDFAAALRIARGCTDYGGGYRSDAGEFAIYQHGIQTVINALTAASERGLADTQVAALHRLGAPGQPAEREE